MSGSSFSRNVDVPFPFFWNVDVLFVLFAGAWMSCSFFLERGCPVSFSFFWNVDVLFFFS